MFFIDGLWGSNFACKRRYGVYLCENNVKRRKIANRLGGVIYLSFINHAGFGCLIPVLEL